MAPDSLPPDLHLPAAGESVVVTTTKRIKAVFFARWRNQWIYKAGFEDGSIAWIKEEEGADGNWKLLTEVEVNALDEAFIKNAGGSGGPVPG